jgi:hypothetical protein
VTISLLPSAFFLVSPKMHLVPPRWSYQPSVMLWHRFGLTEMTESAPLRLD